MSPDQLFSLDGRTVLVTGASSGIGLHLCRFFAERSATVVAVSRSAVTSTGLGEVAKAQPGRLRTVEVDVASPASITGALEQMSGVDVLVNNAGISTEASILSGDVGEFQHALATNLTGPFVLTSGVASRMVDAGEGGSIINISSIAAHKAVRGLGAYAASKAGLEQLTRVSAAELAPHGIRVNALVPGYVRTNMNADYFDSGAEERLARRIPLGRVGRPEDLEGAALFLASGASAYVTGSVVTVDGGFLL